MPLMRAKFRVSEVKRVGSKEQPFEIVQMNAVSKSTSYDADGSDEDNTYARFSPSGSLSLTIANPALCGALNPGDTFYLDFTLVPNANG